MDGVVTLKDEKVIQRAKERFKLAEEAHSENMEAALDDIKFARLGEQWPEDVKQKRENEGRPCLTINRLPAFIRQVVNDARLNTPSIKVHPVDDYADPDTAAAPCAATRVYRFWSALPAGPRPACPAVPTP